MPAMPGARGLNFEIGVWIAEADTTNG